MKVKFEKPVSFSTLDHSFTGEGIPTIPKDVKPVRVGNTIVVFLAPTGEVWECFVGNGTTLASETAYWPHVRLCPRAWVEELF